MGIIGGADGPTVIFVSTTTGGWISLGLMALGTILLPIGIVCLVRRRKRNRASTED